MRPTKPNRVLSMLRPDGTSVRPGRTYVLGLSDFLQQGGDGLAMLRVLPDHRTGKTDLDALIAYLKSRRQPVVISSLPRFISVAP